MRERRRILERDNAAMREALNELLEKLDLAYEQSDIKNYCIKHGHQWYYSLVISEMIKNNPLIVGFNWGAKMGNSYEAQTEIEKKGFKDVDTGSLARIAPLCHQYFDDSFLESASQTNYCLFRSYKEYQITRHDIELCEPIFNELITALQPSILLSFSSKLRDYLLLNHKISDLQLKNIEFLSGSRKVIYIATKGRLGEAPILCLPHPMYQMKSDARQAAWEFCCLGQ